MVARVRRRPRCASGGAASTHPIVMPDGELFFLDDPEVPADRAAESIDRARIGALIVAPEPATERPRRRHRVERDKRSTRRHDSPKLRDDALKRCVVEMMKRADEQNILRRAGTKGQVESGA